MKIGQRKLLILSSLGGVLEFYDFIIFALFAGYLSTAFFPATDEIAGLMITFATFAIGYLVRPLGGVIFGHYGDRIGRKETFTISILVMAFATLGIGITPSYDSIGIVAPFILITLRIMQGFSIGGEIPGAITYVSESFTDQKGLACGIIFCGLLMGIVLGSIVYALILTILSEEHMQSYGWRIPFIIGGIFGLFSYFFRKELHETSHFVAIEDKVEKFPIIAVFRRQCLNVVAGLFLTGICAAIVTSLFLFIPAYFTKILNLPADSYVWERTLAIALGAFLSIFFGALTDSINVKKLIIILSLVTSLLVYPIYIIYVSYPKLYVVAFIVSAILLGFSAGVIPRLLSEIFPTQIRFSGIAVSYNLGFAFFGGLTPFISLSLIYYTKWITVPALYLILVSLLGLVSLAFIRNNNSVSERLNPLTIS